MLKCSWTQPPNDYPTSDGKPMGETEIHRDLLIDCVRALADYFKDEPMVHVTGNLLWFYRQHDRRRHLSPDIMVCFGVPKGVRINYLQWEEGQVPQVVIELTSKTTCNEDLGRKRDLYQQLGVEEYYLFDPSEEYLTPRFRTFHRHHGQFIPVLGDRVYSHWLGLEIFVSGAELRFRDPRSGEILLTTAERAERESTRADEAAARAEAEAARAEAEAARAQRAERELAELKRLLIEQGQAQLADVDVGKPELCEEHLPQVLPRGDS